MSSIRVRWARPRLVVQRHSRASHSTPEGAPSSTAIRRGTGSRRSSPMPAPTTLIGYSPSRELTDGKFHRIEVRVTRPGVRVTARRGYWAPPPAELSASPKPAPDPSSAAPSGRSCRSTRVARSTCGWAVHRQPNRQTEVQSRGRPSATLEEAARRCSRSSRLAQGSGASLGAPQTIAAPLPARRPSRDSARARPISFRMTVRAPDGSEVDRWTDRLVVT